MFQQLCHTYGPFLKAARNEASPKNTHTKTSLAERLQESSPLASCALSSDFAELTYSMFTKGSLIVH